MTAAQGLSAVARSSCAETRASTPSTAEDSTAPISASVDTLWRNRSCNVRCRSAGRPRSHLVAGQSELLCEQMADVARADEADGPSNVRAVVTDRKLATRPATCGRTSTLRPSRKGFSGVCSACLRRNLRRPSAKKRRDHGRLNVSGPLHPSRPNACAWDSQLVFVPGAKSAPPHSSRILADGWRDQPGSRRMVQRQRRRRTRSGS